MKILACSIIIFFSCLRFLEISINRQKYKTPMSLGNIRWDEIIETGFYHTTDDTKKWKFVYKSKHVIDIDCCQEPLSFE